MKTEKPSNKQLRDRHNVKERRRLVRNHLKEHRIWIAKSGPEQAAFAAFIASTGRHILTMSGALDKVGVRRSARRGAKPKPATRSVEKASSEAGLDDAAQTGSGAPVVRDDEPNHHAASGGSVVRFTGHGSDGGLNLPPTSTESSFILPAPLVTKSSNQTDFDFCQ